MPRGTKPNKHAVIDGSNLATEGRKEPSLAQLDEAVRAIDAEYDFDEITVIVDATFEHRVAKSETKAARAAIDDNDILTPPAGVIGRGDAFILQVADRADAVVFSNDSFQEFHGTYKWLFDEGRLIGGKPVPSVGWIYVARSPVRGPVSRRATADSRREAKKSTRRTTSAAASGPMPQPKSPPPKKAADEKPPAEKSEKSSRRGSSQKKKAATSDGSNDPALWKTFKSDFPVGSTIAAKVDRFSSHGAYGSVDDVVVYLPNRLLGDPPPTKARDVLDLDDTVDFVIHRYDDERKGIDAGLIATDGGARPAGRPTKKAAAKKTTRKSTAKKTARKSTAKKTTAKKAAAKKTTAKKTTAKKSAPRKAAAKKTAAKKAAPRKAAAKSTAKKTTAKKTAAKKTTAKKRTTRR
ncbi:MAG: hypothetical protein RIB98_05700 [Acidimicrobiales bacterium]